MSENQQAGREELERRISLFQRLLDHPTAFHRIFFDLTGSVKAALMASQAHYWCRRDVSLARGGWFYKTQKEWEEEVCLTRQEQESARELLRKAGFWFEKLVGNPSRLWFRIDYERLISAIEDAGFTQPKDESFTQAKDGTSPHPKESETTTENTAETTTEERPFLTKPEKRKKEKKAKPSWSGSKFSNARSLDEFPTPGFNRTQPRVENAKFTPGKRAEEIYTELRKEVREQYGRSPGGMTGPMWEHWSELLDTHGAEIVIKAFWLWWSSEGDNLPDDFSRPIAMFLKDASGRIAEAGAKRKKPQSEYVSALDNIPPLPKRIVDHSWENKYAAKK